jgi:hypothetical protein
MAMDTNKKGFAYRGYWIPMGMSDLTICAHCSTPHPPTMLCENCSSFSVKLVKVKDLDPRYASPVGNRRVSPI